MPALAPIPGVAKVAISGTYGTRSWVNTFHVRRLVEDAMTQAIINDVANAVEAAYGATFITHMPAMAHVHEVVATDLHDTSGLAGVQPSTRVGAAGGLPSSVNIGPLINWRIALRYRGGHPRTYLPGIAEVSVDENGNVDGTVADAFTADANNFITNLGANVGDAGALILCVPHYFVGKAPVIPPAVPTVSDILSGKCNPVVGSQRRRIR